MRGLVRHFQDPATPRVAGAASIVLLIIGGLCCTVWSLLLGEFFSVIEAASWGAAIFLPWYAAFEINKRLLARIDDQARKILAVTAVLATALLVCAVLERILFAATGAAQPLTLDLHVARHFPEMIIVALLSVLAALLNRPGTPSPRVPSGELPIAPERIRWIKSAGNYVEIATPARVEMHRMTLGDAERMLDTREFVRVNRTTIVARSLVVRVRPGAKGGVLELSDGRAIPIGQAYRANFADV